MILHLLTDEKFTDYAIKQFSAPEMKSEFVLVPTNNMMDHVKLINNCKVVPSNSKEFNVLLDQLGNYSGIILHGLFGVRWQNLLITKIPQSVKVAWMFWGVEIYSQEDENRKYMGKLTKIAFDLHNISKKKTLKSPLNIPIHLFKRFDYCLTDIYEEYEYAKQYTQADFQYLWYNYYSLEETVADLLDSTCDGNNIWVGNSAAEKNNHLDLFLLLIKRRLRSSIRGSKMIVPLSYGAPWVRNLITKVGRFLFGKHFCPLNSFIPIEQYNQLMLSCSTIIIAYYQPAAQGNIITALWLGMRVYLSEKSMAYTYFKRIGCVIYSIEYDMRKNNSMVFAPMKKSDIQQNRRVLKFWYSKEEMHKRNLEIVKALS